MRGLTAAERAILAGWVREDDVLTSDLPIMAALVAAGRVKHETARRVEYDTYERTDMAYLALRVCPVE